MIPSIKRIYLITNHISAGKKIKILRARVIKYILSQPTKTSAGPFKSILKSIDVIKNDLDKNYHSLVTNDELKKYGDVYYGEKK